MRRTRSALCLRLVGAVGICRSLQILIVVVVANIKALLIKKELLGPWEVDLTLLGPQG
jgi:hypothetical protein